MWDAERIAGLVFLIGALVLWAGSLRGARDWSKWMRDHTHRGDGKDRRDDPPR